MLAINTSTLQFSIGLFLENGSLVSEYSMSPESKNFNGVMPAINHLLVTSNVQTANIQAVLVSKGPGSFTGLRVGLSAAKGFCQGLGIPIIGVSSLEAMASQASFVSFPVCPILDSRKGEVFAALFYRSGDKGMKRLTEETSFKLETLSSFIREETLFIGNDWSSQGPVLAEILGSRAILAPAPFWHLRAASVISAGLKRFESGEFDDLRDLVPAYLRPPDIRPNPFPLLSNHEKI